MTVNPGSYKMFSFTKVSDARNNLKKFIKKDTFVLTRIRTHNLVPKTRDIYLWLTLTRKFYLKPSLKRMKSRRLLIQWLLENKTEKKIN